MVVAQVGLSDSAMLAIKRLTREQISERFLLPPRDSLYFASLIESYLSGRGKSVLGLTAIASALLDERARQQSVGVHDAGEIIADEENARLAQQTRIRILELKGGLGSSFERRATLMRLFNRTKLADKGTDSYFENVSVSGFDSEGSSKMFQENISVAEARLLYYIYLAQQNQYAGIEVQELVNEESKVAVEQFWNTIYLNDRVDDRIPQNEKRTYRQIFGDPEKGISGLFFNPEFIVQGLLPVINAHTGEYLDEPSLRAPGGHAAFVSITMEENAKNTKDLQKPLITVFSNGDGVNQMLPPAVAGWMVRNRVPIVMIITTKQLLDLKGGLITLLSESDLPLEIQAKLNSFETLTMKEIEGLQTTLYPYLLELAQAKGEGQQDIFEKLGIILGEKSAQFFNTNIHAQHHQVLDPFLAELRSIIGEVEFYKIIGPDLIVNLKKKKLGDASVDVIQFEGASGSALLALNRYIVTSEDERIIALKERHGISRLVSFVNFDEKLRAEVFTPEKFTWDHHLYAFTDLFVFDPTKGRLIFTPSDGRFALPGFDLGPYYEDLENDINAFGRQLGVRELDYLAIRGVVTFPDAILKGGVFINNRSGKEVNLYDYQSHFTMAGNRIVLNNVWIEIDSDGNLTTRELNDSVLFDTIKLFEESASIVSIEPSKPATAPSSSAEISASASATADSPEKLGEQGGRSATSGDFRGSYGNGADQAMTIRDTLGGIDLSLANRGIEVNRENGGIQVTYDPEIIEKIRENGFDDGIDFFIINIKPLPSVVPLLLGKEPEEQGELQLTKI